MACTVEDPGGADIVDDHYARAFFAEAFDTLAGAVLLLGFADEEAMQGSAGDGDGHYDRIGSHGQSAYRIGVPALAPHFIEEYLADQLRATSVERSGAAIDVVVAGAAGREFEFAEAKRFLGEQLQEFLTGGGHEFLR